MAQTSGLPGSIPAGIAYSELDVKDGWAYVCRAGAQGGFVVVDVHDPAHPEPVGEQAGMGCSDIKVNDDGDLVFYGTQRNAPAELATSTAPPTERAPRGVYLVNVKDKAHPQVENFMAIPTNGVHTLHYVKQESRELLLVQTYDWIVDGGLGTGVSTGQNLPATPRVNIFEVQHGVLGNRQLQLLSVWEDPTLPPQGQNYFPHDVTVQKQPLDGHWYAYVACWDSGLVLLNIDDPTQPFEVSRFADTGPSKVVHTHQARPFPQLIAGRHVTVLEPELPSGDETGQFTLVDTTDPAHPQRLGYWTLPGHLVIPGGFLFSPHNFNLANGRIYLAHNHAGVWVVDVGDAEKLLHPVAVGYYQPHAGAREQKCAEAHTWSAFFVQGYVYASDECYGLNILRFQGDQGLEGQGPMRVMPSIGSV
ncbi:MAG: hypothetical protein LC624_03715 [Halobacteriales archaeon]|nr:hypothetical protein [Halobacteriales archaeon]